ncbi:MAG: ComEC family competence protein [Oscillospiraceae bacterium]|nr:ComEC family competence protein [Oscillospiraceae bacterium]
MKRPFCVIGFPFAAAMYAAFFFNARQAMLLSIAMLTTGLLVFILNKKRIVIVVALFSAAGAFGAYALYDTARVKPFHDISDENVLMEGIVTSAASQGRRMDYLIEAAFPAAAVPDAVISVTSYGETRAVTGDVIRCIVRLRPTGGAFARNRSIMAAGVTVTEIVHLEPDAKHIFPSVRLALRERFRHNLYAALPKDTADVAGMMVMKIGDPLDRAVYSHMNRSGISHLLAISGLHFSIISMFTLKLLQKTWLPRRVPELATILLGFVFVALTGFSASVLRAFVMFAVYMGGQFSYRRGDPINSLGFSVFLLCVIWPHWTQTISLPLSALSTLGILILGQSASDALGWRFKSSHPLLKKPVRALTSAAGVSFGAYIFTMPLLMLSYGWISLAALPANVLAAPFVVPIILGGIFCSLIPVSVPLMPAVAWAADFCIRFLLRLSEMLSSVPFATISLDQAWKPIWLGGAVCVCVLTWKMRDVPRIKSCAAMLLLCSFSIGALGGLWADRDKIELVALPGNGVTLLIRRGQAVLLEAPSRFDVNALLRYLEFRGIRSIPLLVAPGHDGRIDSGIMDLVGRYRPGTVIGPDDLFVLEQLSIASSGTPIYSRAHAVVNALDGVWISVDADSGDILINAGRKRIRKHSGTRPRGTEIIEVLGAGILSLPEGIEGTATVFEPVGQAIYGETRVLIPIY